jgi:class 3 adenylate cyclase
MQRREARIPVLSVARHLAARIPDARFVLLEGTQAAPYLGDSGAVIHAIDEFLGSPKTEAREAQAAPFRTVLFTDVVGHTEMMRRLCDGAGREVLREHERITRETLKANGGTEVKTMGDGFMASFASVVKGVECAIALQQAFDAQNQESGTENLSVRVGLNAGEPIEDEGDLFGSTVILAARIAGAAEGGEILASNVVRELCSGKPFLFADRGEHAMKGFDEAVRVYEVSWQA